MMGNYEQLKSAIAAVIKTNGNNEITGALLQQVLIGMTSQIGANMTFKGVATPATQPATPDQNCFYMATERGTYSNFDGQELDGTKLAIFFNSSGAWRSWLMPIVDFTFDNTPTEDSTNPVTSDGIFKALMQHDDIIFFADVNGTKYEVEYVWNPRVQDWDELMSDTPLEINAGKIYIDHISFDMFTSPYVGAWIQLNALQASTYSGTVMTEQTAIAPTGTISKTESGVTKTFNLPSESGTLARREETLPNKTYAPAEFSGLGRKYLQKNIVSDKNVLTQAMLQDGQGNALTNYVFVVQYDYDLNGQTVNVPAGTTLKFEGGSIKNGTLNFGKGVLVESEDVKIFDDVLFTGDCGGQYFHIDWFVANYAQTIADTEPDATEEIQAMFDCGIKRVWLTNKHHYRITDTIEVDASINICGEAQKNFDKDNATNKYIFSSIQQPLFTIKANKPSAYYVNYSATIDNIYLYRLISGSEVTSANNYKRDTPTLYIDCTEGSIWGLYIKCFINQSNFKTIYYPADGTTEKNEWGLGYGGVEIYAASGNYATYINIGGYIKCYETLHIHKDNSSAWISAVDLKYDSIAVYGGRVSCCSISSLLGEHQSMHLLPAGNTDGFFDVNGSCKVVGGEVFDTSFGTKVTSSTEDKLYSVNYSIKASYIYGADAWFDLYSKNCINIKRNAGHGIYGNASLAANIIPDVFYNMKYGFKGVGNLRNIVFRAFSSLSDFEDYENGDTTSGTELTEETVGGYAYLFYPDKFSPDSTPGATPSFNRKSYMLNDMAVKTLMFKCTVNLVYATIIINSVSDAIESISIDNGSGEALEFTSFQQRYRPIYVQLSTAWGDKNVKIIITYKSAVQNYDIPYIGICGAGAGNLIGSWGGSVYGDLSTNRLSSTDLSVDKITDVTNIDTPVVNNIYKRTMLSNRGIIPIGDGGGQAQIAHLQYTSGEDIDMQLSFIESGKRWDMCIQRSLSRNATIVRGASQTSDDQAFYVYEKDLGNDLVDLVVTANRLSGCILLDVWGNAEPTVIDDMVTVDTTGYTQTKALMACVSRSVTSVIPESGGLLPNVLYHFGVTDNPTITLNTTDIDPTIANEWQFTFIAKTSACAVSLPSDVLLANGFSWDMEAFRCFHVSIKQIPAAGSDDDYHYPAVYMATVDYIDITPDKNYLTIESLGSGNVTINVPVSSTERTISYSKDRVNWVDTTTSTTAQTITIPVVTGDKVFIKGTSTSWSNNNGLITSSANYNVSGNIMSLLYGDNFAGQTTFPSGSVDAFNNMFRNSTTLKSASRLCLPATTLLWGAYNAMFIGCSGLTDAPQLPATTLATNCYYYMFYGCSSLENAPALQATTLQTSCYYGMFIGCSKLVTTPVLAATTLVKNCYREMFYNCTKVNDIIMLATDISAENCLNNWVNGVASSGTFTKAASMASLPSGASGIPSGWTVEDAS